VAREANAEASDRDIGNDAGEEEKSLVEMLVRNAIEVIDGEGKPRKVLFLFNIVRATFTYIFEVLKSFCVIKGVAVVVAQVTNEGNVSGDSGHNCLKIGLLWG